MKHPEELKTKFLELRARGVPYSRIAEELSVSKPTLIQWGKSMADELADLQAAERELVREKLLGNFEQWLGRQVHHLNRLDEELGRRAFKYLHTESLFRMLMASRKALDRYFFENDKPGRRGSAAAPSGPVPSERQVPASPSASDSEESPRMDPKSETDASVASPDLHPESPRSPERSDVETPSCPPSLLPSSDVRT